MGLPAMVDNTFMVNWVNKPWKEKLSLANLGVDPDVWREYG